jgi:DNA-directed RNA polymerase specialized sigma24 family protein
MTAKKTSTERPSAPTRGERPQVPPAPPASRTHWRQILGGSSPREVLARFHADDPLGLRRCVASVLRRRSYLFDADRVHLRAMARCARFATRYRGQPPLGTWLGERVEEALLDLLHEDLEGERRGQPLGSFERSGFEDLAGPLGLDPERMRAVCVAFNHRPEVERRAFFALVIEGRTLDEVASEQASAPQVARRARRVLEAVLAAENGDAL